MYLYDLEKIIEMWTADASIDETNLGHESVIIPKLHAKYIKILSMNNLKVKRLETEYSKMRAMRSKYYDGKLSEDELKTLNWEPYQYKHKLNSQIEELLQGDSFLIDILTKKMYHQEIKDVCERIVKELSNRTWQIKNALEWNRYTNGG